MVTPKHKNSKTVKKPHKKHNVFFPFILGAMDKIPGFVKRKT